MRRSDWLPLTLILLALGAVYAHVRTLGVIYEDTMWLQRASEPWTWAGLWQPSRVLTIGSYALQLGLGHSLGVIHLTNVALHGLNTILLWRLVRALELPCPVVVAAIFALHPLQVETVAYLTSRGDALAVTGILLAVTATVRTAQWTVWRVGLVTGLSALTLLAKESAAALVLLLPLAAWCGVIPRRRGWWLPTATVASLLLAGGALKMAQTVHVAAEGNLVQWCAVQSVMVWKLLGLTVWPWSGLSVDHDPESVRQSLRLIALIGVQYWVFLASRLRARSPQGSFALLWIVLALWPRLVIQTPESTLNEHQVHAATIGVALTAGWLWDRLRTAVDDPVGALKALARAA